MGKHNEGKSSTDDNATGDEDEKRWRQKFRFRIVLHDCVMFANHPMHWSRMSLKWRPKQQLRLKKHDDTQTMPKWIDGKCPWPGCGKRPKTTTKQAKEAHWRTHTKEEPFACEICGRGFRQRSHLHTHRKYHSEIRPFPCLQCKKTFKTKGCLTEHARVHSDDRPFPCTWNGCSNRFKNKQALRTHTFIHTGEKPHKCTVIGCNKAFRQRSTLAGHIRAHNQERPFVCDFPGCNRRCVQSGELLVHKRIHTGEKRYTCTFPGCTSKFNTSGQLVVHERGHNGKRPYLCPEQNCDAAFRQPPHLQKHIRAMHTKEGRLRKLRDQERFFKTLREEHKIVIGTDEREFRIDMSCLGETNARLDGVHYAKDFVGALECNEFQHKHYPSVSCDVSRALKIRAALTASGDERPLAIYNFNPHSYTVDDEKQKTPYKDRIARLAEWLTDEKYKPTKPLSLFYFYYDMETMENTKTGKEWAQPCLFSDPEYPQEVREFVRCVW